MRYVKMFQGKVEKVEAELNGFYAFVETKKHRVLSSKMVGAFDNFGAMEIVVLLVVDEYCPPRRSWERGHGGDSSVTVSE